MIWIICKQIRFVYILPIIIEWYNLWLRFGLANAIKDYVRLRIIFVFAGISNL